MCSGLPAHCSATNVQGAFQSQNKNHPLYVPGCWLMGFLNWYHSVHAQKYPPCLVPGIYPIALDSTTFWYLFVILSWIKEVVCVTMFVCFGTTAEWTDNEWMRNRCRGEHPPPLFLHPSRIWNAASGWAVSSCDLNLRCNGIKTLTNSFLGSRPLENGLPLFCIEIVPTGEGEDCLPWKSGKLNIRKEEGRRWPSSQL